MLDNDEEESVQAAHGRWIRNLQESVKNLKKDLEILEKRVSTFEEEVAEYSKFRRKMKSKLREISANQEENPNNEL